MSRGELPRSENVLEEEVEASLHSNARTKISFLQDEKERLELTISELAENNGLLRAVNQQLTLQAHPPELIGTLSSQNALLEQHYIRILRENEALTGSLLLQQQVMDEAQLEHLTILRQYEAKIIELRRAIQTKESNIQEL
jgi:hypothetical protein